MRLVIKRLVFFASLFLVWELAVRLFQVPAVLLPAPTDVFRALGEMVADGTLFRDLGASFMRLLVGLAIALLIGLLLGILLAKSKTADETLGSLTWPCKVSRASSGCRLPSCGSA